MLPELTDEGYGMATAEIVYRRPDRLWLLQTYVWQDFDMAPAFPALHRFLDFWKAKLDGPLVSVSVSHAALASAREFRSVDGVFRLN